MKTVFALLAVVLIAGCYKQNPDPNSPFGPSPNPGTKPTQVGFSKHAWCYEYSTGTRDLQERFLFSEGGTANYREYNWINGQRSTQTFEAKGTWVLNGNLLQIDMNGKQNTYQITYNVKDSFTGRERLHVFRNGSDVSYDPCF